MNQVRFEQSIQKAIFKMRSNIKQANKLGCKHMPVTPADWWEWFGAAWEDVEKAKTKEGK